MFITNSIYYQVFGLMLAALEARSVDYIIGGEIVAEHSEPYILSLQRRNSHFCGGTIISATHGICASHCVYPANEVSSNDKILNNSNFAISYFKKKQNMILKEVFFRLFEVCLDPLRYFTKISKLSLRPEFFVW